MNSVKHVRNLELTLAIIKPDVVAHPRRCQEIKQVILENKFYFVRSQEKRLLRSEAERFYAIHKGRFFFNRLVGFMSSGPLSVHILARHDAIAHWRHLMGPTKTFRSVQSPTEFHTLQVSLLSWNLGFILSLNSTAQLPQNSTGECRESGITRYSRLGGGAKT